MSRSKTGVRASPGIFHIHSCHQHSLIMEEWQQDRQLPSSTLKISAEVPLLLGLRTLPFWGENLLPSWNNELHTCWWWHVFDCKRGPSILSQLISELVPLHCHCSSRNSPGEWREGGKEWKGERESAQQAQSESTYSTSREPQHFIPIPHRETPLLRNILFWPAPPKTRLPKVLLSKYRTILLKPKLFGSSITFLSGHSLHFPWTGNTDLWINGEHKCH